MVTRFHVGTNRSTERLNLHVSSVSPLPKSYRDAFNDPNWQNAMRDKYIVLIKNKTWTLVPRPPDTNIVRCMWLFRHKYLADGTLSLYKARLVANGSTTLRGGLEVEETLTPSFGTPVDTESKGVDGDLVSDPTLYRSLAGSLQYLTFTRPNIYYAVSRCLDVGLDLSRATLRDSDSVSAVYLSSNPVQHQRTKHIEIDINFVRDLVAPGQVSPTTCRWGILAAETSSGIQSPVIIPGEDVGLTHFSVKEVGPRWQIFSDDMSLRNLRVKAK
ncbi:ribonuclease H-like domain-containing protein [Tanacetum coccineum]